MNMKIDDWEYHSRMLADIAKRNGASMVLYYDPNPEERDLLMEARAEVQKNLDKYQATMDKLNYKISRYEEAVKTGVLTWDAEDNDKK